MTPAQTARIKPIVLYKGPSVLDGAPIVCIATLGSSNAKTGPMVQTWILRQDMEPTEASKQAADSSVCGDCPRRHATGGDCYVTLFQAPLAVYRAWAKAGKPGPNWFAGKALATLRRAAQEHGFRMGSYGDPMAVPHRVWQSALALLQPTLHTGYTHQWRGVSSLHARGQWFRENVMASCDSIADAALARANGWRYFMAIPPDQVANVPERTIECLAERPGDKAKTCEECGICNGTQGREVRASVYIVEHGARSSGKHKRSAALQVLQ